MIKAVLASRMLATTLTLLFWGTLGAAMASGQVTGSSGAAEHIQLGVEYFNKGHYQQAPQEKSAEAEQNYRLAEKEFRAAIAIDPSCTDAHRNLARTLYILHNYSGAAEEYRNVIEQSEDDLDAYVNLALTLIELKKIDEALTTLETAKAMTTDENSLAELDQYLARLRAYQTTGGK